MRKNITTLLFIFFKRTFLGQLAAAQQALNTILTHEVVVADIYDVCSCTDVKQHYHSFEITCPTTWWKNNILFSSWTLNHVLQLVANFVSLFSGLLQQIASCCDLKIVLREPWARQPRTASWKMLKSSVQLRELQNRFHIIRDPLFS